MSSIPFVPLLLFALCCTSGVVVVDSTEEVSYTGICKNGGLALTPEVYSQGFAAYKDATCIPDYAFCQSTVACASSPGSSFTGDVILENMEKLTYVGVGAFQNFKGKVAISGSFLTMTN